MKKLFIVCLIFTTLMANGSAISYADSVSSIDKQALKDTKGHWAQSVIDKWTSLGVITGYADGEFRPNGTMTRAGITVMLNRLFRAAGKPAEFRDVSGEAWYAESIAAASTAGYITGYPDGTFRPNNALTRADAAVILGKAFQYQDTGLKTDVLRAFKDQADIPGYAQPFVTMLVESGYVAGYPDGKFHPERSLTRAEAVQWMDRLAGQLYNKAGVYDAKEQLSNAIVNTDGVVIRNKNVTGQLYLAPGIGDGEARVEKSTVKGRTFVNGGGSNSIHLSESDLGAVTVNRPGGSIRVVIDRGSTVKELKLQSAKRAKIEIAGQVGTLTLTQSADIVLVDGASIQQIILEDGVTDLSIQGGGDIETITVLNQGAVINGIAIDSKKVYSWNNGKIEEVNSTPSQPTGEQGSNMGGGSNGGEPTWLPLAAEGSTHGTTKVNAAVAAGNQLAVKISNEPISAPTAGAALVEGRTVSYPYEPNSDLSGVDAVTNKYLGVYEVDRNKQIVRFKQIVLSASQIRSEAWTMVWNDEFDGAQIDQSKWNFVQGGGGYGNNELQNYTNRTDNARLEDGQLVIEARQENFGGNAYTSAKLTTQGKGDWTYGKFEIRAKMPSGQGIWPAIWMMPSDENLYSGWPASGEIDIMELLGHEPNKVYGTLHYGVPHGSSQGTYTLPGAESFADKFHTFTVEWEPGEFRYYVDGILYSKMNDWFAKNAQEGGNYTYPAPFDRDFFMQLNLAVGGSWPGNPDAGTVFSQKMLVDYVRVYELEGGQYRKPVDPANGSDSAIIREPGADGNYVTNGGFDAGLQDGWVFQPFAPPADLFGGSGTTALDQGALKTSIDKEGNETYAIQLVQANLPIVKGSTYQLSFDAWSEGARGMVVDISGPDRNYSRYLSDQTVQLSDQKKTYTYTFSMKSETDPNGRLEFNMGKAGLLPVWLDNVRLIRTAEADPNEAREVLPSGNYVYNGTFDQGKDRLGFWTIGGSKAKDVHYAVGSTIEDRLLHIHSETSGQADSLLLSQDRMKLAQGKLYVLSFDAKSDVDSTITAKLMSMKEPTVYGTQSFTIGKDMRSYSAIFTMNDATEPYGKLAFELGGLQGHFAIDNVVLKEMAPPVAIQGVTRVEAENYSDMSGVQKGEDGKSVGWIDPGDWMQYIVDVKQPGKYNVSYFVASGYEDGGSLTLLTKPGSVYTGNLPVGEITEAAAEHKYELVVPNTGDWGAFTIMKQEVELNAGIQTLQLYAPHVNVDYMIFEGQGQAGRLQNVIQNGTFDHDVSDWTTYQSDKLSISAEQGSMKVHLPLLEPNAWDQQVYQEGLALQQGVAYTLSFQASSTVDRPIQIGVGNIDPNNNYAFTDYLNGANPQFSLTSEPQTYTYTFVMNHASDTNAKLEFDLGQLMVAGAVYKEGSDIYLDNIRLVGSLIRNGQFDSNADNWTAYWGDEWNGYSTGIVEQRGGELVIQIDTTGSQNWNPQISQEGLKLEQGKTYRLSFDARAEGERKINVGIGRKLDTDPWYIAYFGSDVLLNTDKQHFTFTFTMSSASEDNARIDFNVGMYDQSGSELQDVFLDNIMLIEVQ